ncbi:MAG TPA: hypothetical protein VIK55_01170 [Paludibacter sp.]
MKSLLKVIGLIFIIIMGFAIKTNSQTANKSNVGGLLYFPLQLSDVKGEVDDKMDDFQNKWYSKHLGSMNEPILYDKADKNLKIFRYTNLGTWTNPFIIRVELKDSIVIINYKRTNGKGGYGTGKVIKDIQKQLLITDWNKLFAKVDSIHFWNMHSFQNFVSNGVQMVIMDGTEWIFEGLKGDKYHFVTRNTPDSYGDKAYASLCNLMSDLFLSVDKATTLEKDQHLEKIKLKI